MEYEVYSMSNLRIVEAICSLLCESLGLPKDVDQKLHDVCEACWKNLAMANLTGKDTIAAE